MPTPSAQKTYVDGREIEENLVSKGLGTTYGVEILLRHLATESKLNDPDSVLDWLRGRFYGWIAYTLSRSVRRDMARDLTVRTQAGGTRSGARPDTLSDEYPSNFDQTHILTFVGQVVLPWGLEAGLRFRLVTGNPLTPLNRGETFYDVDKDSYRVDLSDVAKNSDRLPVFHQLDVRIDKTFIFDLWKLTLYAEVLNVYNAANVEQYQYDYRYRERVSITGLTTVPVVGIKGEF